MECQVSPRRPRVSQDFFGSFECCAWERLAESQPSCRTSGWIILAGPTRPMDPITERQMMIGVYNHLRNERYLGSMKPFSEGDWIPGVVGNEGPSTFTGRYIGDETSLIPY